VTADEILRDHLREEGIPAQQIEQALQGWTRWSYFLPDGEIGAVIMMRGPEIHVVLAPEHRGKGRMTRGRIQRVLQVPLALHGYVTTRTAKGNGLHRLFLDRLGFKPTWSDDQFTYFMLTELPFGKGT